MQRTVFKVAVRHGGQRIHSPLPLSTPCRSSLGVGLPLLLPLVPAIGGGSLGRRTTGERERVARDSVRPLDGYCKGQRGGGGGSPHRNRFSKERGCNIILEFILRYILAKKTEPVHR